MDHNEYKEKLSALLDGELTASEREETLSHMETCEACRAYFAELIALHDALGEMEEYDAPEGFADGVLARLHTEKPPRPAKKAGSWRKWGALAACAAVVVLAAVIVPNNLRMGKSADSDAMTPMLAAPAAAPAASAPEAPKAAMGDCDAGAADEAAPETEENMLTTQLFRTEAADAPAAEGQTTNADISGYDAAEKASIEPDLLLYGENAEYWLWNNGVWNEEQEGYWVDRDTLRHLPDGLTLGTEEMLARWNRSGDDFAFVRSAEMEARG